MASSRSIRVGRTIVPRNQGTHSMLLLLILAVVVANLQIPEASAFAILQPKQNANLAVPPEDMEEQYEPEILYESDRILAINKPTEISHHDDGQTGELGIVSRVREYYNHNNTIPSRPNSRLYGVHRLDRVTSGILLFAKDKEMASILGKKFKENEVIKYYVGITNHKPQKQKQGFVKGNMVRGRRKSWYLTRRNKDNYAITRFFSAGLGDLYPYKLKKTDVMDDSRSGYDPKTCLLFRPETGKTHQIRVAAKSVGMPLIADPIYGGLSGWYPRCFLHATAMHIPLDGVEHEPVTIFCKPPFAPLLWDESVSDLFENVVCTLFQKHCESSEILDLAQKHLSCPKEEVES